MAIAAVALSNPTPGISAMLRLLLILAEPLAQAPPGLCDLLIEPTDARELLTERIGHHGRQALGHTPEGSGSIRLDPISLRPCGMTSPYSLSKPRRPLICALRNLTAALTISPLSISTQCS